MKIITTLLFVSACSVPGLQMGSTLSPSSPAPASSPAGEASPGVQPAPSAAAAITHRDVEPIDDAAKWLTEIHAGQLVPGHGTRESELRDRAMFCSQQVENLISHGEPKSASLPLENTKATLGEADANICQPLVTAADGWDARAKHVYVAQRDADLEPYKQVGVSGDKLKLVGDLGKQLIGPGHAEATPDVVARASVLFSLRDEGARLDGGHDYTIVRYAFRGNTQIAVTEKGFHAHPNADQFR